MKHRGCPKILALIPARSGSKSIPDKNIRIIAGKPLLAHSISHALASRLINRIIVSTDSPLYAEIARRYGAEVPFLRPSEISQDLSTDLEVFIHALDWLKEKEGYVPDICVHLRPTYPIRKIEDIDRAIQILLDNPDIDSVRSVAPSKETPMKIWFMGDNSLLFPVVKTEIKELYNLPRQMLPKTFTQNGCIDAVRAEIITKMRSMTGEKIFGYVMNDNFDIDTEEELKEAELYLSKNISINRLRQDQGLNLNETFMPQGDTRDNEKNPPLPLLTKGHENLPHPHLNPLPEGEENHPPLQGEGRVGMGVKGFSYEKKRFCFDIDGVIATIVPDKQYDLAGPQPDVIEIINSLYDHGHHIILFTARGSLTGIEWTEVTRKQLRDWGVKYHELIFGKPAADYYIDDKMLSIEKIKYILNNLNKDN